MNRHYIMGFIACTALALTGCSNEEIGGNNGQEQGDAIEFGTYLGRDAQSRGTVVTESDLKTKGFGVFAAYTGTENFGTQSMNFMSNQKVTYSSTENKWTYTPVKYWPNNPGAKVSFFAYAPYVAGKTWSTGNKLAFTVENDVTQQTDLLFCTGHPNLTKQAISDNVTFAFKHALSRIGFTVAYAVNQIEAGGALASETTIKVNSVTLSSAFYKGGSLTMTAADADAAWGDLSTDKQGFTLGTANFEDVYKAVTNTATKLNKDNSYIMIIPKTASFDVTINYTVTTTDSKLNGGKSEVTNKITTTVPSIAFKANKAYTLNLVLGMTSVKVSATVADWTVVTPATEVKLPANVGGNSDMTTSGSDSNGNSTDVPGYDGNGGDGEDY